MNRYRFEVDNTNAIRIWDTETPNENDAPFLFQPDWPDVTPWDSAEEASDWADYFIAALVDPKSELIAGNSPDTHPSIRPEPDQEIKIY